MFYTDRLMLRAVDPACDASTLAQWMNEEETAGVLTTDGLKPVSSGGAKTSCEKWAKHSEESGYPFFAICKKPIEAEMPANLDPHESVFLKDGRARYPMIGCLMLTKARGILNRCTMLAIVLSPRYRDKGYGTEVMRWACPYVFNRMGMHRFELRTTVSNTRAIKCYSKAGFVQEGLHRDALFINGEWVDCVTMALLAKDWRKGEGM